MITSPQTLTEIRRMYAEESNFIEEIRSTLGISHASLYRCVKTGRKGHLAGLHGLPALHTFCEKTIQQSPRYPNIP